MQFSHPFKKTHFNEREEFQNKITKFISCDVNECITFRLNDIIEFVYDKIIEMFQTLFKNSRRF